MQRDIENLQSTILTEESSIRFTFKSTMIDEKSAMPFVVFGAPLLAMYADLSRTS